MSKIRSKNTLPETTVRKTLFLHGLRYRLHVKDLPGKPDIVLKKYKTAILVHGCFWHGHACKIGSGERKPKSNIRYWQEKLWKNIKRDKLNEKLLKELGWLTINIWECETRDDRKLLLKLKPLLRGK